MDNIEDNEMLSYQPPDIQGEDEIFDLGDNVKVSKRTLMRATHYAQKKAYQIDGEVSFLLPLSMEEEATTSDSYEPLTFLRGVGFQRNQAKEILQDPIIFTNIYIVLKEARLWTQSLKHPQATLLYEAAVKLKRGRRAAEYIALVTDAIISGNIPNYEDLTAFIKFVNKIDEGVYTWDQVIPLALRKEIKKIPYMLHQFEVEKVFTDTMNLVRHLREHDDLILMNMPDATPLDLRTAVGMVDEDITSSGSTDSFDSDNTDEQFVTIETSPIDQKLIRARRNLTEKEITKQCCIFANYYDPSMYKYVPLMAHMIARGYFSHYIQIEAVADFLRPVCGMRLVKLLELLQIVLKVAERTDLKFD